MSWKGFWHWVDGDFNHVRPHSMLLFMGLLSLPLGLSFAIDAPSPVIEFPRAIALVGFGLILLLYYIYRQVKNVGRRWADSGQNKNG